MKKITILTAALTVVTASLLASCGSTSGNGQSYPTVNSNTYHNSNTNHSSDQSATTGSSSTPSPDQTNSSTNPNTNAGTDQTNAMHPTPSEHSNTEPINSPSNQDNSSDAKQVATTDHNSNANSQAQTPSSESSSTPTPDHNNASTKTNTNTDANTNTNTDTNTNTGNDHSSDTNTSPSSHSSSEPTTSEPTTPPSHQGTSSDQNQASNTDHTSPTEQPSPQPANPVQPQPVAPQPTPPVAKDDSLVPPIAEQKPTFSPNVNTDLAQADQVQVANTTILANHKNPTLVNFINQSTSHSLYSKAVEKKETLVDDVAYDDHSYGDNNLNNYLISNVPLDLNATIENGKPQRHDPYYHSFTGQLSPVFEQSFTGHFNSQFKPSDLYIPSLAIVSSGSHQANSSTYFSSSSNIDLTSVDKHFSADSTNANEHLGFYLGYIASGLPQDHTTGLNPASKVYTTSLDVQTPQNGSQPSDDFKRQLAKLDQVYSYITNNQHPTVITTSLASATTDPFTQSHPNFYQPQASLLAKGIELASVDPTKAPLFVFSTGNYTKDQYQQALTTAYASASDKNTFVANTLANPNSGLQLDKNSALAQLVANKQVNPYFIVATGAVFDPNGSNTNLEYNLKQNASVLDSIAGSHHSNELPSLANTYLGTTALDSSKYIYNSHSYSFSSADSERNGNSNKGYVYSPVGSFQCGAAAFNCLAAPYSYDQPFTTTDTTNGKLKGTEYAAAYISGAALLVKQKYPWMTASNLKTTLLTTATDVGTPGIDPVYGWGVLNLNRALQGPSQLAFGEFRVDFGLDGRGELGEVTTDEVVNLFATDPYIDHQPLAEVSQRLHMYDFSALTGAGSLTVTNSNNKITSGLRIGVVGYQGATTVDHAVLVLENPLYYQNYLYTDAAVNHPITTENQYYPLPTDRRYHKAHEEDEIATPDDPKQYTAVDKLPKLQILNIDQDNHRSAYENREDTEQDNSDIFETKVKDTTGTNDDGVDEDPAYDSDGDIFKYDPNHYLPGRSASHSSDSSNTHTPASSSSDPISFKINVDGDNGSNANAPSYTYEHNLIAKNSDINNFDDDAEDDYAIKLAQRQLTEQQLSFHSPITINANGIVVNNLPQVDSVTNNGGYYFPYSFITYGQYGGYMHANPYLGSVVHNFTQSQGGTLVVGVGLKAAYPYKNNTDTDDLSSHTVSLDIKYNKFPVVMHYYSNGLYGYDDDFDTIYYSKPYARNNRLVATTVFSDQAHVAGNVKIYFNFGAKMLRDYLAKTNESVTRNFVLDNTDNQISYLPTTGTKVALVSAKTITGSFDKVSFVNSAHANLYNISSVEKEDNFLGEKTYVHTYYVTITPKSSDDRVVASSGTSILDSSLLSNSAKNLTNLYHHADAQFFGTNTNQNYLALASAAQSSDNSNFRTYLYQNALTIYPDLQLASSQNTHTQVSNFIDRVSTNYLHSVSHSVYFDYNYRQTNWTSPTSAVFGQDKGHNLSLGYYGQSYGLNYGIAGIVNYGNWQEDLTSLNADLAHLQANNLTSLASAKTLSAGLVASLGKALPRSFYALNLATTFHNYDLNRNLLFLT